MQNLKILPAIPLNLALSKCSVEIIPQVSIAHTEQSEEAGAMHILLFVDCQRSMTLSLRVREVIHKAIQQLAKQSYMKSYSFDRVPNENNGEVEDILESVANQLHPIFDILLAKNASLFLLKMGEEGLL